ncbi:MAG: galactokinase [Planctomycetes bacterium]|nr:galactokinase [Planctomycetota bacterium]
MGKSDARIQELAQAFQKVFAEPATQAARAPGRVNLIGEHTDYNDGFCLPIAIDRDVLVLSAPRDDNKIAAYALQKDAQCTFEIVDDIEKDSAADWADYVKGCVSVLREEGLALRGCSLAISGNVPLGSGLSSSAALEVAVIHALLQVSGLELDDQEIAVLAQRAENSYVGVNCGILDQLSSACCQHGMAMLMDCRSLELQQVPLPDSVSIVIADTGKRRGLVDSAYNERRQQCEAGAAALSVPFLRDASMHALYLAKQAQKIDQQCMARCEHIVAENGRTMAAAACLRAGDMAAFGQLMDQSHADLRDKFEVTCDELDDMVSIARALPGCLGSRMTGAGFGGCTVSLLERDAVENFVVELENRYAAKYDLPVAVYVTSTAAGAGCFDLEVTDSASV